MSNRKHPRFGDQVTNTAASDRNPIKYGIFVRVVRDSYRNRYGITHSTTWYEITDGNGNFWKVDPDAIKATSPEKESA